MSDNNDNDTTQAGPTAPPGQRRPTAQSGRNRSNRDIPRQAGTGDTPGPTGITIDDNRTIPAPAPTGRDEGTTDDQVPPHGFTQVVADGTRHRHHRRAPRSYRKQSRGRLT